MAKHQSIEKDSADERRVLQRFCELVPLFRIHSITGVATRFDAVVISGKTMMDTEVKNRTDLRHLPTVIMNEAKWLWLKKRANPMFIAFCLATGTAYVWDLSKVQPLEERIIQHRPPANDAPKDAPRRTRVCVQFSKKDADHIMELRPLKKVDPLLMSIDYVVEAHIMDWTDIVYLFPSDPHDMVSAAQSLLMRSLTVEGYTPEAMNVYRNAIWQDAFLAAQLLGGWTYEQTHQAFGQINALIDQMGVNSDTADAFDLHTMRISDRDPYRGTLPHGYDGLDQPH